jgi:8-oxo-dGTP pyrophosphatase MutT (NUDIX family)
MAVLRGSGEKLHIPLVRKVNHKDSSWKFPGGGWEPEDNGPNETIRRELREETGLLAINLHVVYQTRSKHRFLFICGIDRLTNIKKEPVRDGEDILQVKVFTHIEIVHAFENKTKLDGFPLLERHDEFFKEAFTHL